MAAALTDVPQTPGQIAKALGMEPRPTSARLGALVAQGRAARQRLDGVWYYFLPDDNPYRLRHPPDPVSRMFTEWLKA